MHILKSAQLQAPELEVPRKVSKRCVLVGVAVAAMLAMVLLTYEGVVGNGAVSNAASGSGSESQEKESLVDTVLDTVVGDEEERAEVYNKAREVLHLDGEVRASNMAQEMMRYGPYPPTDPEILDMTPLEHFKKYGAATFEGALDQDTVPTLISQVLTQFLALPEDQLGNILTRYHRYDVPQKLKGPVKRALCSIVGKLKHPFLRELLGKAPRLAELSTLLVFPGAGKQLPHRDSGVGQEDVATLISFFVPLIDIEDGVGGTEVWPGTAYDPSFEDQDMVQYPAPGTEGLERKCPAEREILAGGSDGKKCAEGVLMKVRSGGAVMMDSMSYHRSSYFLKDEKSSERPPMRPMFYFSLVAEGKRPEGPTYSLLEPEDRDIYEICEADSNEEPDETEPALYTFDDLLREAIKLDNRRVAEIDAWTPATYVKCLILALCCYYLFRKILHILQLGSFTKKDK